MATAPKLTGQVSQFNRGGFTTIQCAHPMSQVKFEPLVAFSKDKE